MRNLHRRVSVYAGVLLFVIALSGVALQIEMLNTALTGRPAVTTASVADGELPALMSTGLAGIRRQTALPLMSMELRLEGAHPVAQVLVADPQVRMIRVDARTGALLAAEDESRSLHRFLLDFHRSFLAGTTGMWISLVCGIAMVALAASGITVYIQMYLRRRNGKNRNFIW